MSNPEKKLACESKRQMQQLICSIAEAFGAYDDRVDGKNSGLNRVAAEFGMTPLKARKLLITAGVYTTETSRRAAELVSAGMSLEQIQQELGLSRASVQSYLPYTKLPYKMGKADAECVQIPRQKNMDKSFRERIDGLSREQQDEALWEMLSYQQGNIFRTAKGLQFTYVIRGGEMFVDRKAKSITKATVCMAFHKALELREKATGPKKLGTFGASYLYPIFLNMKIIEI